MSKKVKEWTVLSMLEWATEYFEEKNIPNPRHSIEWLLAETLNIKRLDLYLKYDRPLSPGELEKLRPMVKQRAQHEPLQYIIGFTDFMNARISVDPSVLIPRIETEQLVEIILDRHPDSQSHKESLNVFDIGTGSGCIPIALKMERPHWNLWGIDISEDALETARQNAQENEVDISFKKNDILKPESIPVNHPLDIIVSNPPYITPEEKTTLEPQVYQFEPSKALFTEDMEQMYRSILKFAGNNLSDNGKLYLELHEHYSSNIQQLCHHNGWNTDLLKDYDKKERFLIVYPK